MKVLVLGGTGAMGVHLVELLSKSGYETFVTTRSKRSSVTNIHYIQGNAHNTEFLQTILQEHWDVIVDFMVYSTSDIKERVKFLLEATSQYVFLSSARVYANSDLPITENSPRLLDVSQDAEHLATDEYALSKARQEDILNKSGRKNWTVIRPYITYSENRLQLGVLEKERWLYRALHGRTIVFSSDIMEKTTTLTYGLDVAKGILSIIGNNNALGEEFHITNPKSIKWSEVLSIYLSVLEKHLGYKPKILLKNIDKFLEWNDKYQVCYDRLYNRKFDNSKISQCVDVDHFIETKQGLKQCLESFLKNPQFQNINWKMEAIMDRQTRETTLLKEISNKKDRIKYYFFRHFYIFYVLLRAGKRILINNLCIQN